MYLNSVNRIDTEASSDCHYPFDVRSLRQSLEIRFTSNITLFTGDNGAGKSTLLEAIAAGMGAFALGFSGQVANDPYLSHSIQFAQTLSFVKGTLPRSKMFLRAEDVLGYIRAQNESVLDDYLYLHPERAADPDHVEATRRQIIRTNPLDSRSHGESFLDILRQRLHGGGLYFLDEPETPLSVANQIGLANLIRQVGAEGGQLVIVTHWPILLALPDATIYQFDQDGIELKTYDALASIRLLKRFMASPERYLQD